jgi:hypothetical protein
MYACLSTRSVPAGVPIKKRLYAHWIRTMLLKTRIINVCPLLEMIYDLSLFEFSFLDISEYTQT